MRDYGLFSLCLATAAMTAVFVTYEKVLAIGCDTYYRVTGQIAGCTDVSTEKAQELWLEKYNICLEQQLAESISFYKGQLRTYYAQWDSEDIDKLREFDRFSGADLDTSLLLSTNYTNRADFCPPARRNRR